MKPTLAEVGSSRYSQYGEDGMIARLFEVLKPRSRVCVEFGAWDGLHLSNTANLWMQGWRGVLIEGDRTRFEDLRKNTAGHDCVCINAFVRATGPESLAGLLERHGVAPEVDLLSIDIDGDDYYIFASLSPLRPRVVVVEYNPTVPAHLDLFADPGSYFGASVAALARVGTANGYRLVALTDTNAFFVVAEEASAVDGLFETSLERIRVDTHLAYLVTSYAGDYVVCGKPAFRPQLPYRGTLHGEHRRLRFKPAFLRILRLPARLRRELGALLARR